MNKKRTASVVSVVGVAATVAVGSAFGASSKPWQAVVGHHKTTSQASAQISKLGNMGFSGDTTETEKRGQFSNGRKYEVEKGYATQKQAKAAVAKLHKAGFKGAAVENEKSEKTSG